MVKNNKQIAMSVLKTITETFGVKARANIELFGKEAIINVTVMDIPESVEKYISNWANKQKFELSVMVYSSETSSYQNRINNVCGAANAMFTMANSSIAGQKKVVSYNRVDQAQAKEALWLEDQKGIKAVIDAVFVNQSEVAYA